MKAASMPRTIDEYIAGFPEDVRAILARVRATIRKAAPGAEEAIKYRMPAFLLDGNLVFFAAFKGHIGLYPAQALDAALKKAVAPYRSGKGSVQFPLDRPIPNGLIAKIVRYRVKENRARAAAKGKAKGKRSLSSREGRA